MEERKECKNCEYYFDEDFGRGCVYGDCVNPRCKFDDKWGFDDERSETRWK